MAAALADEAALEADEALAERADDADEAMEAMALVALATELEEPPTEAQMALVTERTSVLSS